MALIPSDLEPLARRVRLAVEPPSLTDTAGDLQRILRVLKQGTGHDTLEVPLDLLARMGGVLRRAHWTVQATLAMLDGVALLVDLEEADLRQPLCGLAVDVGTTTLAVALVDLETGRIVGERSDYNPQRAHGEDVTSRMIFCEEGGLTELRRLVVCRLNGLIADACQDAGLPRLQERLWPSCRGGPWPMLGISRAALPRWNSPGSQGTTRPPVASSVPS